MDIRCSLSSFVFFSHFVRLTSHEGRNVMFRDEVVHVVLIA